MTPADPAHRPLAGRSFHVLGAGRVGALVARLAILGGAEVRIWSRRHGVLEGLPDQLASHVYSAAEPADLRGGDIHLLTVPDAVLPRLVHRLAQRTPPPSESVWLHTSGVTPVAALTALGEHIGSVHPLQSIDSPAMDLRLVAGSVFALAGAPRAREVASTLCTLAAAHPVDVPDAARAAYHAACVLAGNGVFSLIDAASTVAGAAGLDAAALVPAFARLAEVSAHNVAARGIDAAMTGPVARGDVPTVAAHRRALGGLHDIDALYVLLGRMLVDRSAGALTPRTEAALRAVLEALGETPADW